MPYLEDMTPAEEHAHYRASAEAELKGAEGTGMLSQTHHLARAQVFATLALAATQREPELVTVTRQGVVLQIPRDQLQPGEDHPS